MSTIRAHGEKIIPLSSGIKKKAYVHSCDLEYPEAFRTVFNAIEFPFLYSPLLQPALLSVGLECTVLDYLRAEKSTWRSFGRPSSVSKGQFRCSADSGELFSLLRIGVAVCARRRNERRKKHEAPRGHGVQVSFVSAALRCWWQCTRDPCGATILLSSFDPRKGHRRALGNSSGTKQFPSSCKQSSVDLGIRAPMIRK